MKNDLPATSQAKARKAVSSLPINRLARHGTRRPRVPGDLVQPERALFLYSLLSMCHGRTTVLSVLAIAALFSPVASSMKRRAICIFGSDIAIAGALHGKVYYLQEGAFHLPVFSAMKPISDVYATALNIPTQDFQDYFPGVRSRVEWFGIEYQGYFWIRKAGEYRFSLASDDGSQLFIDDRMIVNNDGLHPTTEQLGKIVLGVGSHHMRVGYFQGIRDAVALILQIAPPEASFRLFDTREYRPPMEVDYSSFAPGGSYLHTVKPASRAALDALDTHPLPNDFEFGVRAVHFPGTDGASQYALAVEIPKGSLTPKAQPLDKKHRVHAHVVAMLRNAQGDVVNRVSQELNGDMSDPQPVLSYQCPLWLAPGFYTIETAVMDWQGNRASTRVTYLYNQPQPALTMSDPVLVRQLLDGKNAQGGDPFEAQGKRVVPLLASILSKGATPYVYFVANPNRANTARPRLQVQLARNGEVVDSQTTDLPAADSTGRIPMVIGAAAQSGNWDVQIGVMQGKESVVQHVTYTIQ